MNKMTPALGFNPTEGHIPGFRRYRVTRDGRIMSSANTGPSRNGPRRWSVMKQATGPFGHRFVMIVPDDRSSRRVVRKSVHALVLQAFVGPRPEGMLCCHGDGDPTNNRVENLRWDTPKANCADTVRHGRANVGDRRKNAVLKEADVREMRRLKASMTLAEIADRFAISEGHAGLVIQGKRWSHIPKDELLLGLPEGA